MIYRDAGQLDEVLLAIVARLINQMPDMCKSGNTYLTLNPDSIDPSPGAYSFTVSPLGGSFPAEFMQGGGVEQVTVETGFTVTIHSPLQLDMPRRDVEFLTANTKGVLGLAKRVLKAMTLFDPQNATAIILRDPITPTGFSFRRSDRSLGSMELEFRLMFDWDIS